MYYKQKCKQVKTNKGGCEKVPLYKPKCKQVPKQKCKTTYTERCETKYKEIKRYKNTKRCVWPAPRPDRYCLEIFILIIDTWIESNISYDTTYSDNENLKSNKLRLCRTFIIGEQR